MAHHKPASPGIILGHGMVSLDPTKSDSIEQTQQQPTLNCFTGKRAPC